MGVSIRRHTGRYRGSGWHQVTPERPLEKALGGHSHGMWGVRVERKSGNEEQGQKDTVEKGAAQGMAGVSSFMGTHMGVLLLGTRRAS